ncbi:MAG: LysM peptidoglycan-binding domain-containing protein [Alphaproteobacteria bacterium]
MRNAVIIGILLAVAAAAMLTIRLLDTAPGRGKPPAEVAAPAEPAKEPEAAPPVNEVAQGVLPTFDIVRVDRTGSAVLAGRSQPGAKVRLYANGKEITGASANKRGEWTMVVETPLEAGNQELTLKATLKDGEALASEQKVVVAVPARADEVPLVVLDQPGAASRVLQGPGVEPEEGALALSSVDYDKEGGIILSGQAEPETALRIYLDNDELGTAQADGEGRWTLKVEESVLPGVYTLRVDELTGKGKVARRVELPFERASPEDLKFAEGKVVVQPGNSLWRISRFIYGEGLRYTVIYEANRNQIRDPDLIYPGQIFQVPGRE